MEFPNSVAPHGWTLFSNSVAGIRPSETYRHGSDLDIVDSFGLNAQTAVLCVVTINILRPHRSPKRVVVPLGGVRGQLKGIYEAARRDGSAKLTIFDSLAWMVKQLFMALDRWGRRDATGGTRLVIFVVVVVIVKHVNDLCNFISLRLSRFNNNLCHERLGRT